jgi:hypothetical protein
MNTNLTNSFVADMRPEEEKVREFVRQMEMYSKEPDLISFVEFPPKRDIPEVEPKVFIKITSNCPNKLIPQIMADLGIPHLNMYFVNTASKMSRLCFVTLSDHRSAFLLLEGLKRLVKARDVNILAADFETKYLEQLRR